MRLVALAAGVALVALNWDEKGGLFWVGVAVVVLNAAALELQRAATLPASPPDATSGDSSAQDTSPAVDPAPEVDATISDLLHLPAVAEALAQAPSHWRQVTYFDQAFDPVPLTDLVDHVWVLDDEDGWSMALGDEVKPLVDLDVEESDDAALAVFVADARVSDAPAEDREVYRVETSTPLTTDDFAVLAVRALTAQHLQAAARLDS